MTLNKFTIFLTLACSFSSILAAPIPQATTTENFQPFAGALGGTAAPAVIRGDDGFTVEGKGSFTDIASALAASCDVLKTQCTNAANSADGRASGLTLAQCEQQDTECRAAIAGVADPGASQVAKTNTPTTLRGKNVRRAPAGGNVQPFTGALGGKAPPAVTPGGLGFQVAGGDSFADLASALVHSCDVQKQDCLNANVPAAQCDQQASQCQGNRNPPPPPPADNRPRSEEALEARQREPIPPPPPSSPPRRPRSEEAFEKRQGPGQPGGRPNTNAAPSPQNGGNRNNNNNIPPPPPNNGNDNNQPPPPNGNRQPPN